MAKEVRVYAEILDEIIRHARRDPEIECCGLLAGRCGIITSIFPAANALLSPTVYEIAPRELFSLFRRMREEGLAHLGIYHSHPRNDNSPSPTDIEKALYPEQAYFIVSPHKEAAHPLRAFSIENGIAQELEIVVMKS